MNVANHLIYNNQLECGSEEVARGHLCLPLFPSFHISEGWMEKVLNPQLPVLFLDTDQHCDAMETITGELICNRFEANLVAKIVLNLIKVCFTLDNDHIPRDTSVEGEREGKTRNYL